MGVLGVFGALAVLWGMARLSREFPPDDPKIIPPGTIPKPQLDKAGFVIALRPLDAEISKREGWRGGLLTAWAALESDYGRSKLANPQTPAPQRANNLYGIKAGPMWQKLGRAWVEYQTTEYSPSRGYFKIYDRFRAYPDWRASMEDVVKLMKIESVYRPVLQALQKRDLQGFYRAIQASPYSTAPDYASRIARFKVETDSYA